MGPAESMVLIRAMTDPAQEFPMPPQAFRRNRPRLVQALGRAYLRMAGWRAEGRWPEVPKCVAIVAPHTSNWDFFLGLGILFGLDLRVSWLGKHAIFRPPVAGLLRRLGGIPVDRRAAHGVVGACAEAFRAAPTLMLALSPEGTRKSGGAWKSGFYHIAVQAGVPIFPVSFDFPTHVIRFMDPFQPTGDLEGDLPRLMALFEGARGLRSRG